MKKGFPIAWLLPFLFLLLAIFHAATLHVPLLTSDESNYVDFAYHGILFLWRQILPPALRIHESAYGYGYCFVHIDIIRFFLNLFGVGVWQARFGSYLAGILSLLFIANLYRSLKVPFWPLVVLYIGFCQMFFFGVHSVRQDALLVFLFSVNIFWLLTNKRRLLGVLSGFLAGIGFAVHLPIVFIYMCIPVYMLVIEGKDSWKNPRYAWWIVGVLLGLNYIIPRIDLDNFIPAIQLYFRATGQAHFVPMFKWKWDVIAIAGNAIQMLMPYQYWTHHWSGAIVAAIITLLLWEIRRFSSREESEKKIIVTGATFLVGFALTSASASRTYLLFLIPWLLPTVAFALRNITIKSTKIDATDLIIMACCIALCASNAHVGFLEIWIWPFLLRLLIHCRGLHKPLLVGCLFFISAVVIDSPDAFMAFVLSLKYPHEWGIAAGVIVLPWLLFKSAEQGLTLRGTRLSQSAAMAGLFGIVFLAGAADELVFIRRKIVETADYLKHRVVLRGFENKRILGPGELWPYYPSMNLQTTQALFYLKGCEPAAKLGSLIERHKPDTMLLLPKQWPIMTQELAAGENKRFHLQSTSLPKTPFGPLLKIDFQWKEQKSR